MKSKSDEVKHRMSTRSSEILSTANDNPMIENAEGNSTVMVFICSCI